MSMNEPFLPITPVSPDEIDADPGPGAAGTLTPPPPTTGEDHTEQVFEDRGSRPR